MDIIGITANGSKYAIKGPITEIMKLKTGSLFVLSV